MTPPSRTGVVETESARLVYDVAGEGEAVVLVHSGIADRRMWDPQFSTLAEHYRTVRYDMQGFGDSAFVAEGTDRGDLVAFTGALGIPQAHLVGSSFGASVALDAALEHPELVRSLTLVGPTVGGHDYEGTGPEWKAVLDRYEASVEAFEAGAYREAAEHEAALWVVGPGRETEAVDADLLERIVEMDDRALRMEAAGRRREDASVLDPPAADRLSSLSIPVHVVVGAYDLPSVGEAAGLLVERAPDAQLSVVDDAAHLPNLERPEAVTDLLLEFWASVAEGTT
ncbi:alpha/beta fold hydrolase [Halomarina oriensis]|uniref:Alpha/beta fold hydrolase n=1 Tax=Halomarina oriensis TaxID=671145 RepID=A0A6B0GNS0_9EURY|nr:alpha/beta hydrolase [Halomarina oriensis]MWG36434.1 alpha/beta fold hydrolase [Halomarina oriensis]